MLRCALRRSIITLRLPQVYKEFQALYEGKLEEFLSSQGIDAYEFAVQCKKHGFGEHFKYCLVTSWGEKDMGEAMRRELWVLDCWQARDWQEGEEALGRVNRARLEATDLLKLLAKLQPGTPLQAKLMEILSHVNRRVKALPRLRLPMADLLQWLHGDGGGAGAPGPSKGLRQALAQGRLHSARRSGRCEDPSPRGFTGEIVFADGDGPQVLGRRR